MILELLETRVITHITIHYQENKTIDYQWQMMIEWRLAHTTLQSNYSECFSACYVNIHTEDSKSPENIYNLNVSTLLMTAISRLVCYKPRLVFMWNMLARQLCWCQQDLFPTDTSDQRTVGPRPSPAKSLPPQWSTLTPSPRRSPGTCPTWPSGTKPPSAPFYLPRPPNSGEDWSQMEFLSCALTLWFLSCDTFLFPFHV